MFLLGCLPLRGREGVTFIAFFKRLKSDRISSEIKKIPLIPFSDD